MADIGRRRISTLSAQLDNYLRVAVLGSPFGQMKASRTEVDNERSLGQLDDLLVYFDERQARASLLRPAAERIIE